MVKELMLVSRALYCAFFTLIGMNVALTSLPYPETFAEAFVFLFVVSLFWQYCVLYVVMNMLGTGQRVTALMVWTIISFIIGACGLNFLRTNESLVVMDFIWQMGVYLVGAGMYIGGICTRRAYMKYKML